jgi:transposase
MRPPSELHLTEQDRRKLTVFRAKGRHSARELNRAHILAALDQKLPQSQIRQVLGVERTALWRTAKAYQDGGLDYALHDLARSGKPRQYQTDQEAEVVALACSQPPAGAKRWTIRLLVQASRRRPKLKQVSRETIRRFLKKTSSNPGAK